jgi:hypothetical protein
MAGDGPGYEAAIGALYGGARRFDAASADWPKRWAIMGRLWRFRLLRVRADQGGWFD